MRLTEQEFLDLVAKKSAKNNSAGKTTDMESITRNEPLAKKKSTGRNTPDNRTCCIHIHHKRTRLADPDGISIKAAIDGIVLTGVLADDNAKIIKEISQSQEKSKQEETIIDIIWEDLK